MKTETSPEFARLVQLPGLREARRIGLAPAGPEVAGAVAAVAVETALAMASVLGTSTAVVDPIGSWILPGAGASGALRDRAAAGGVELVGLAPAPLGSRLPALAAALAALAWAAGHVIVDLSGLDASGEHLEAIGVLDAIAVLALAGRTTTPQLAGWMRELPPEKNLGVLLVGGRAG